MFHALAKSKGSPSIPATKKPPAVRILFKEKIQTAGGGDDIVDNDLYCVWQISRNKQMQYNKNRPPNRG